MLEVNGVVGLRINHRNLYNYVLNHHRKSPNTICFIPPSTLKRNRLDEYLKVIEKLESLGLIVVDRERSKEYTEWVVTLP
jgi:peptidase E